METSQPIAFELDHVEFKLSKPSRHWKITKLNSAVVSYEINALHNNIMLRKLTLCTLNNKIGTEGGCGEIFIQ